MDRKIITEQLSKTFGGFSAADTIGVDLRQGKVRDIVDLQDELLITTTDRISAFDRILTTIPFKGEVLNRMALHWFKATESLIIGNHLVEEITSRTVRVKKCCVLPLEIIVRGYLTGSAWRDYQEGRPISGHHLPKGMRFNQAFDQPLLTPSTKEEGGLHDQPISAGEILAKGLVTNALWRQIEETALALYRFGVQKAAENGLILVDTKYEFGLLNNQLVLIDELHTPDSSRFWYQDTYEQLFENNQAQRKLDKEYLRQWLTQKNFKGDGQAPIIPDEVRVEVAARYLQAFKEISGREFESQSLSPSEEIDCLRKYFKKG